MRGDSVPAVTSEKFCELVHTPRRTVRDWRRRDIGPHRARSDGCGRLYITVAEARRSINAAIVRSHERVHA